MTGVGVWQIIIFVPSLQLEDDFELKALSPASPSSAFTSTFYRTQVNLGSDLWVRMSVRETPFADLTGVTLADEDTKSIPTDNVNRAIPGNVVTQVNQPWNRCQ